MVLILIQYEVLKAVGQCLWNRFKNCSMCFRGNKGACHPTVCLTNMLLLVFG